MSLIERDWLDKLQEVGCRLTTPRRAVVNALASSTQALTPVEAYEKAQKKCPEIGLVSVYRTIEKLEELGLVQRVHRTKKCQAFIKAGKGHQHLLICNKCGEAMFFNGDQLDALFQKISKSTEFVIESHWLQVYGLCKSCKALS